MEVEEVIVKFTKEEVLPYLLKNIKEGSESVKYWNTQIAINFPDEKLIPVLNKNLSNGTYDLKYFTITLLEVIGGDQAVGILQDHYGKEENEEIKDLIDEALNGWRSDI